MSSNKDIQTKEETNQHPQENNTYPSFTIQKIEDAITTTVILSTHQSEKLDEFYILHRETGKRYPFLAEKINDSTYRFTLSIREFIRQHTGENPKAHFEFYFSLHYLEDSKWIKKDESLSLDRFDRFNSIGLSQFKDQGNDIYPYFSRKTNGFCFTVNIPVRSIRYIYSSKIEKIKSQRNNILVIDGKIVTKAIPINRIDAVMVGRRSNYKLVLHSNHHLEDLEQVSHLYHYDYSISVDLNLIATELFIRGKGDEDFDFYFEVYLDGLFEPTVVRVTGSCDLKSRNMFKNRDIAYGRSVYVFSPNFTEQYNGLSLAATKYGKEIYEYYKEVRGFSRLLKPFVSENDYWIIGEKPLEARSNGWLFFCYLRENYPEINAFYVLDKDSIDYEKAISFDSERILLFKSKKYVQFLMKAQVILTSQAPYHIYPTRNPLWLDGFGAKRVLLQNNIIGLQSLKQTYGFSTKFFRTDLFIVSSKHEKRYVIDTLGYPEEQVVLSGLPRFDKLLAPTNSDNLTKQLVFCPADQEIGLNYQTESILRTVEKFATVIDHKEFKAFLATYDLTVTVALPHAMASYFERFAALGCTVLLQEQTTMLTLLNTGTVFITDYHPLAFDFSFLTKPVCFFQPDVQGPDKDKIHSITELYSNELPGEVTCNEDDLIYLLNQIGQNNFKMSNQNQKKADALLEYKDTHSNQRIYEAVSHLLSKKENTNKKL
ncbi:CDP-glycerol glycerophosphotransferase, TagB/SpsB family [Carnobacterium iners]|uniref:CDP-glycerol glycerophosphotransferase, TagB/SpsB family n=1 Tax=Carnobacterium iners TaxID=1073423 RepID=A0A1X7N736_9LACT|nr:CDP-glycerol glycerophosphotransferase family protein [Carnobacterium iners]SEK44100.1 CDP-glycerol glycerophosphotransferase, TagB/SpsB family [Carnobacterium iners]SMH32603.1 CDP-glycerol glycerophosphotransferase, TagB/SpsB family [Carnobacterium iners]